MRNLLRAAAEGLANLSEKAHEWADRAEYWDAGVDPSEAGYQFAGVDLVGIDFSTSIQQLSSHVIRGWNRYCDQTNDLRPDHGIWAFGLNSIPFVLTRRPVPPRLLPSFREEHFQRRGEGRGLIEFGSAFYDYFLVALGHLQAMGLFDAGRHVRTPVTVALLCDGAPNGGTYRASDVRPLVKEARDVGVRFKIVGFALRKYRYAMHEFRESLGLTHEELEMAWYDRGTPDEHTIDTGFGLLSSF